MMSLLIMLSSSFGISLALTPLARKLATQCGLVDRPDGWRKIHAQAIPVAGGIPLLLSCVAVLTFASIFPGELRNVLEEHRSELWWLLLAAVVICAVGLADDLGLLRVQHKWFGQLLAVGILVASGLLVKRIQLFGWGCELGLLAVPFTAFWLLGAINSLNLIDGVDGLLSSVGVIICLAMTAMAVMAGQWTTACVAITLSGALLAFLYFNFPPAGVFLGDSGSMLIGLVVGVLAIQSSLKASATIALVAPLATMTIPILDTAAAIIRRSLTGRTFYTTDRAHLHHCLLRRGLSNRNVLLWVSSFCLLTVAGALASSAFNNELFAIVTSVAVVSILVTGRIFGYAEFLLLKARVVRTAVTFWHGDAEGKARQIEVRLQGSADWSGVWDNLMDHATKLNLFGVCLNVNVPALHEGYHAQWGRLEGAVDNGGLWRAEIPLATRGQTVGRLEFAGRKDQEPVWRKIAALSGVAESIETTLALLADGAAAEMRDRLPAAVGFRRPHPARGGEYHANGADRIVKVETEVLDPPLPAEPSGAAHTNGSPPGDAAPGRSPLRVCHLGKFYRPAVGGMESHLYTLAHAQVELGADVTVLCVNHLDPQGHDVTWSPFATTRTVEEWDGPIRLIRVGRRASVARFSICPDLPRLIGALKGPAVDVLHVHVPNPTMLLALAMVRSPVPLVVTYQSDVIRQKILGKVLRPLEHFVYSRAARLFCSSPTYPAGSKLLQQYQKQLSILPLGIDLAPYLRPSPAALAYAREIRGKHGRPLWLAVGRLVYYKGLHNAIEALEHVPGKLLIIGEGPFENDLRQLAKRVGVADRVIWSNRVSEEELVGAYHAATALWFPSNARSESFGLVQVEAMASGCPVINAAIPASGVPWVCPHEHSGLTVPVNDPGALAQAARRLLTEPGLRGRLSSHARQRACQEFDYQVMARRSLETYRAVLLTPAEVRANALAAVV